MFTVYAIINNDCNKIYIGYTENIKDRLLRHNGKLKNKKTSFTHKNKGLWELIYREEHKTRAEAKKREKELKSYQGRKFIKKIIEVKNMRS